MDALATFVLGLLKNSLWAEWLKFIFQLLFSGLVSFLQGFSGAIATCGAAVLTGKTPALTPGWTLVIALGAGAGWAAITMTKEFRQASDKLTRGMTVTLPAVEAAEEFSSQFDTQTITKSEKKP